MTLYFARTYKVHVHITNTLHSLSVLMLLIMLLPGHLDSMVL